MPVYILSRSQIVRMPLASCWSFFSNPANLSKITPPELRFRVHSELPDEIYAGLMIRYTVSPLFGVPLTWVTEITQVQKPHFFVDAQRVGPYRLWHHEHSFRATSDNETEVRDLVHYAPPFGPVGAILNVLTIRRQLDKIFAFRAHQLERLTRGPRPDSFA